MNKVILSAALRVLPNKIQVKAICKALNFLFVGQPLTTLAATSLSLSVGDLKKHWVVAIGPNGFEPLTDNEDKSEAISLEADFATILACQKQDELSSALASESIEVRASTEDKQKFVAMLQHISQEQLDALLEHCYSFFRVKAATVSAE